MARYTPDPEHIEDAIKAALMLDVRLSDARYYLHRNSKMNKRLVALVDATRDIRNALDQIKADLPKEAQR